MNNSVAREHKPEIITQAQLLLHSLLAGNNLSSAQAQLMMQWYMEASLPKELSAAILIALRMKGESVAELVGCVQAMKKRMNPVALHTAANVVELVGTGGDGQRLFNISSASCFVAAAAGAPIAKHFNKSNSSKSGGADFLAQAGAHIQLPPETIAPLIKKCGIAFMFAPLFHPAMRHVAPVRQLLATRTIFNLLGPLANPASIQRAVVGVFDPAWQMPIAEALRELGYQRAWVVHTSGTDELMVEETNHIVSLHAGTITREQLDARQFGLRERPLADLQVDSAGESAAMVMRIMQGDGAVPGFATVVLNAAAALYLAEQAPSIEVAIALARETLLNNKAVDLLHRYCAHSHTLKETT